MSLLTHSEYLAAAAEAARLFPDPTREIGPAGLHWLGHTLKELGAGAGKRLDCYLAIRRVLFNSNRGDLVKWFAEVTVGDMIATLEAAACEVL